MRKNTSIFMNAKSMIVLALLLSSFLLLTGCGSRITSTDSAQATQANELTVTTATEIPTTEAHDKNFATEEITLSNTSKPETSIAEKATEAKENNNSKASNNTSTSSKSESNSTSSKPSSSNNSTTSKPDNNNTSSKPSGGNSSQSGNNTKPTTPASDPHAGKTYHEAVYKTVHHDAEYKDVYVVDQEAYSYEKPIYEEHQITVCHVCGAEFDTSYSADDFFDHIFVHEFAGEGSGYHSTVRKIQVGSETVNVPEEGHYEKKLVKAAWDEKVLVKEAGWY